MAVENIHGYIADPATMTRSGRSMVGFATKNGTQYQFRSYSVPIQCSGGIDNFGLQKERIYSQLRGIFGMDPHIRLPAECLIHNGRWYVFTEQADGDVYPENRADLVAEMSVPERIALIRETANTLMHLHRHNIVHGTLTCCNIMPVIREGQLPSSQLTGLEDAFFGDTVPECESCELSHYAAPEQTYASSPVSVKADMFSLGLILHEFLAGCDPVPDFLPPELQHLSDKGGTIHPWQILTAANPDGSRPQLIVSPQIEDPCLIALISDMLHPDPTRRPKAESVSHRLNSRTLPIESKTWPGDGITINPEVARQRVIGLRKYEHFHRESPPEQLYEIIKSDGRRACLTSRQLIHLGIASIVEIVDMPWPGDHFRWDEEKLKTMFVCARRGSKPGLYQMTDRAGSSRQCTADQLKMLRFAVPTRGNSQANVQAVRPTKGVTPDGLWVEDDRLQLYVNPMTAASMGLLFDGPVELCGIRGYQFTDQGGNFRFISRTGCQLLNLLIPK